VPLKVGVSRPTIHLLQAQGSDSRTSATPNLTLGLSGIWQFNLQTNQGLAVSAFVLT
jgi:hypothetical protein